VSGSSVPDALTALVNLWTGAAPAGLTVSDGPVYDPKGNYLAVGWNGTDTADGVDGQSGFQDAGFAQNNEIYDVHCLLSFHEGSSSPVAARSELFDAFNALDAALAADHTLGGLVLMAQVGAYRLEQSGHEDGSTAFLRFAVRVQAWK